MINRNRYPVVVDAERVGWSRRTLSFVAAVALAGIGLGGAGCSPPPPEPVHVRLVNNSSFTVDPFFYLSSTATSANQLFISGNHYTAWKGDRVIPTLKPREKVEFSLECTAAAKQPVFTVPGAVIGIASVDTVFLRRPGDFDCGATVVFTYTADPNVSAYHVAGTVE